MTVVWIMHLPDLSFRREANTHVIFAVLTHRYFEWIGPKGAYSATRISLKSYVADD